MGVDLRLLPLDCDSPQVRYSHTIIQVSRSRDLWSRIADIGPRPLEADVASYIGGTVQDWAHKGEPCYGELLLDPYGDRYTWMTAGELVAAFRDVPGSGPAWTVAYLAALPPGTRVVLAWR